MGKKIFNNQYFLVSLFFLFLFLVILFLFKINFTSSLDNFISYSSIAISSSIFFSFAKIISAIGSVLGVFIIIIILSYYLYKNKNYNEIILLYLIVILDLIIVYTLKYTIGRIRPDNIFLSTLSFPSGHTTMGVVLFGFIFWFFYNKNKLISISSLFLLIFMGFSRIIINIHWFTDVLAGYFLGFSILFFGIYLYNEKYIFFKFKK